MGVLLPILYGELASEQHLTPVDGAVKDEVVNLQGKVSASILGGGQLSLGDQHQVSVEIITLLSYFVHGIDVEGYLPRVERKHRLGPQGCLLQCMADVR